MRPGVLDKIRPFAMDALRLRFTAQASASYLGGNPTLPAQLDWPSRDGRPLTCLASFSLAEIAALDAVPWLPATGRLLFFYDVDEQPWGFDPADRGGWVVLRVDDAVPERIGAAEPLPKRFVRFERIESLPGWERCQALGIALSDAETDEYIDASSELHGSEPLHQVSGYPSNVQDDSMELQCQLASSGIWVGDPQAYDTPEARQLGPGASEWRLLFQHEGDDDSDLMWGDCGSLFFWVKESDARQGDFSNAWLVLQCS